MIHTKKGQAGESIMMIYRLVLLSLIAFAILGINQYTYKYYIDTKQAEATIISRGIATCLFEEGTLHLDRISKQEQQDILQYCGYKQNIERYNIEITIEETQTKEKIGTLTHGDSGVGWVRRLLELVGKENIDERYIPGRHTQTYNILLEQEGTITQAQANIEVLVTNEA